MTETKAKTKKTRVVKTKEKKDGESILRMRVRAYENKILDVSVKQIIETALRYDAQIRGPIPLPTEIKKYTVNRSTFIYKDTREQFEIRIHRRLIDIVSPTPKVIEALTNLSLPSGVEIDVKMM
ncbi:30S ribosomal protein S10 [Candidatus Nomurabacteria bacterium]|nr:30S ribosomal protein S10 [Candidatus Nomurabacteria bacterium]MCB9820869.1 30S ribosomal protein S10 [Candidatus Nomurabacteria bacterium]